MRGATIARRAIADGLGFTFGRSDEVLQGFVGGVIRRDHDERQIRHKGYGRKATQWLVFCFLIEQQSVHVV